MLLFIGITMFVILILGFPMFMTLSLTSLLTMVFYFPTLDPIILMQQTIGGISTFVLLAIPLFIFAADIMVLGHTANRLIDFVKVFVGHIYGGLGVSLAGACTMFGAISGSTQATVVAIGKPMRQSLIDAGYENTGVNALIISAANIASLIPPSIGMIIFCVLSNTSVAEMFIAGVGPGVACFLMFSVYNYFDAKRKNVPRAPRATWKERLLCTRRSLLSLGFPVLIVGGIYSGFFSPTEAAAISALYAIVCEMFVYRTIGLRDIYRTALSTGAVTSAIFILIAVGQAFSWLIAYVRIPQELVPLLLGADPSAIKVLYVVTVFYFVGCMFVDPTVVHLILVPLFFPVAVRAGVDPIHLGIVITLQASVGGVTPPFGVNIFTACAAFNQPYVNVVKGIKPYLLMFLALSLILIYFPQIALFYRWL